MRLLVATLAFASSTAFAQSGEPEQIATYRDWMVFTYEAGGDRICYAVTEPEDVSPSSVNHGDVFFSVASWASGQAENQPSFMAGYDLQSGSEPIVRVGSDRWEMFTTDATQKEGFIEREAEEQRLIDAMRRGREMRVSATSSRSTSTNYTFSLLGVSKALERVEEACS